MTNQELLGSGQWYFVNVRNGDTIDRFVIDEREYDVFFNGLNKDAKFVKVQDNYYFWSDIKNFGPIKFDDGVLSLLRGLPQEQQDYIKKRIRSGQNITTLERLRSEVSFFISTREEV